MGTEVAISFSTLRAQLENEKSSLHKIDQNIKKIVQTTGRFSDRFITSSGEFGRGPRLGGGRNLYPDSDTGNNYTKNEQHFGKRKIETKTVFSRLSGRDAESECEEDEGAGGAGGGKRARVSSAVSREMPTRAEVLQAQAGDEQARVRNRRIFGSLLGTLQKFKQEEIVLQTKEDKKAQVEKKIEEQARQLKEKEQKERKTLFAEREHKKASIKALEAKMARVQELESWEQSQRSLGNFILTKIKPHIYWLPKKMTDKAAEKLKSSRKFHEKCMARRRDELQEELQRIEQRCLRPRANQHHNENDPHHDTTDSTRDHHAVTDSTHDQLDQTAASKRDKFATDVDQNEKEDSDGDDHHQPTAAADASQQGEEVENGCKMDTAPEDAKEEEVHNSVETSTSHEAPAHEDGQPIAVHQS